VQNVNGNLDHSHQSTQERVIESSFWAVKFYKNAREYGIGYMVACFRLASESSEPSTFHCLVAIEN
jgi:hypothetical protein